MNCFKSTSIGKWLKLIVNNCVRGPLWPIFRTPLNSVIGRSSTMWKRATSGSASLFNRVTRKVQNVSNICGWSYAHGASDTPLLGINISRLIDEAADKYNDREAVVECHQGIRKNFIQLREDIDKLAAGLVDLGLKKGDRVGIWGTNSYHWILTQFATARVGLILVNINPGYLTNELEYCLNKVGVSAVIADESFKTQNYYQMFASLIPEMLDSKSKQISSKRIPSLKYIIMRSDKDLNGAFRFDEVFESSGSKSVLEMIDRVGIDDPVNIQFTSGTTGNPKGATLSHHNIVNNSYTTGRLLGYHLKPHRVCLPVPLYHCLGCVIGSLNILTNGICCVLPAPSFQAEPSLKSIDKEKCTSVYGTPTMFVDMLNHRDFNSYDCSSLEIGIMTGAPCPEELVKQVVEKMHPKDLVIAYGTTETSPAITLGRIGDSLTSRATQVGKPIDHVEVKVVDDNNHPVPFGSSGELCSRGYNTMLGYWNDEEKTREAITATGWYHTGDICAMNDDGYVKIVGRKKDMVIRGGENIYPSEIESFLHTHPLVAEAHVVGVPDKRLGEELCVWIKVKTNENLSEAEIRSFCKGKISHFKIPKYIKFVTEYPTTVTGKIQKFKIRDEMIKELQLSQ